jgi:NADH:ubiquinone oxidoreductase subunit 3 (subunit A)
MKALLTPVVVLMAFLIIVYLIYRLGGALAPKVPKSHHKLSPYACGEDLPGGKVPPSYTLFHVAFIFTVFHVAILLLALVPSSEDAIFALIFLAGLFISAVVLFTSGGDASD